MQRHTDHMNKKGKGPMGQSDKVEDGWSGVEVEEVTRMSLKVLVPHCFYPSSASTGHLSMTQGCGESLSVLGVTDVQAILDWNDST